MIDIVRLALKDWGADEYTTRQIDVWTVAVSLGLDLVQTTPALGGNAASALLNQLVSCDLEVAYPNAAAARGTWNHLLDGGEVYVRRAGTRP